MILRRNYTDLPNETPLAKPASTAQMQDYEILLQFDLKREKEKNLILQQRLKNKENFIQQMKHFQEELTLAYEQCKNDLIIAQEKIQYLQNVEFREYTQQIADLKHMVMLKTQQSKRNSLGRDQRQVFSSVNTKVLRNRSDKVINKSNQRRQSKTSSHYATHRQRSVGEKFEAEVSRQLKKSANFISHFLQMAECYVSQLKTELKLTKKLKRSWKWIKDVVKEWDVVRDRVRSLQHFKEAVAEIYNTEKDLDLGIFLQLIRNRHNDSI